MKRVALITGVTGFIGGELARRLIKDNWCVVIIVRAESDLSSIQDISAASVTYEYDGTTGSLLTILGESKPDVVFHLASLFLVEHTPTQITELIDSNVLLGTQLLEAMVQTGVKKLINTGTTWQYSGAKCDQAVNLYAATKRAFDAMVDFYHDAYGISVVSLILSDTYGVGDKRSKLINLLVAAVKSNGQLLMSPGDQVVDISHVSDVVKSYEAAALGLLSSDCAVSQKFAVSGTRLTVKELVTTVEQASGKKLDVKFGGRPYRNREVMVPPVLSLLDTQWKKVELLDGIRELVAAST